MARFLFIAFIYAFSFFVFSLNSTAQTESSDEITIDTGENVEAPAAATPEPEAAPATAAPVVPPPAPVPVPVKAKPVAKAPAKKTNAVITDNRRFKRVYATLELESGGESLGQIRIRLFNKEAPNTVNNFVGLAEGTKEFKETDASKGKLGSLVKRPFYDGLTFHRVIPNFMIQGGCPFGNGRGSPVDKFADEFHPNLSHRKVGMVSMANAGPNTNGSQFFITVGPTEFLDKPKKAYSIFGEVVSGLEVAEKASKVKRDASDKPLSPITIKKVTISRES